MSGWGLRIKQRREELGLSVAELARQCGVKPPSVIAWENGETKEITGPNLLAAADALQCSPYWILHGTRRNLYRTDTVPEPNRSLSLGEEVSNMTKQILSKPSPEDLRLLQRLKSLPPDAINYFETFASLSPDAQGHLTAVATAFAQQSGSSNERR